MSNDLEMPKPIRLWIEALESGEYSQGKHTLHMNSEYCCLGVGCVIAEQEGIPVQRTAYSPHNIEGGTLLSQPAVKEWLGISHPTGILKSINTSLVTLNDGGNMSFKQIAAVLREHWHELSDLRAEEKPE